MKLPRGRFILKVFLYVGFSCVILYIVYQVLLGIDIVPTLTPRISDLSDWFPIIIGLATFLVTVSMVFVQVNFYVSKKIEGHYHDTKELIAEAGKSQKELMEKEREFIEEAKSDVKKMRNETIERIKSEMDENDLIFQQILNQKYNLRSAILQSQELYEISQEEIRTNVQNEKMAQILISLIEKLVASRRLESEANLLFSTREPIQAAHLIRSISTSPYGFTAVKVLEIYHKNGLLVSDEIVHRTLHEAFVAMSKK